MGGILRGARLLEEDWREEPALIESDAASEGPSGQ